MQYLQNLWIYALTWAFLVLMVGGFTSKNKEYRQGVYKTMAIAVLILLAIGWLINLD